MFSAALAANDKFMKPGSGSLKPGEIIANKRRIFSNELERSCLSSKITSLS